MSFKKNDNLNCCVMGLGYIGLPTAAIIANSGINVLGVDINDRIVELVNQGDIHIYEPDLKVLISNVIEKGRLLACNKPSFSDVYIIAVPTPFKEFPDKNPEPNLEYVMEAVRAIIPYLKEGNLILIESTCPVGTSEKVKNEILNKSDFSDDAINIAYCPERVIPGNIIKELVNNDRVVGGLNTTSSTKAKDFYSRFCQGKIHITDSSTAELIKLTENSYRDVNLAFANELSILCHNYNVDVRQLIKLANHHPRVNILQPGCGVGGHCIAVDPWFLISENPEITPLIQSARKVNDLKKEWVYQQIIYKINTIQNKLNSPITIACFGISYKPNVNDLRESPAMEIVERLKKKIPNILIIEPNLISHPKMKISSMNESVSKADLLVFLVSHKEFENLDISNKTTLDFCGVLDFQI